MRKYLSTLNDTKLENLIKVTQDAKLKKIAMEELKRRNKNIKKDVDTSNKSQLELEAEEKRTKRTRRKPKSSEDDSGKDDSKEVTEN